MSVRLPQWIVNLFQASHERLIPYRGHISRDTVINHGNRIMGVCELHGLPFELASPALRNARALRLNTLLRTIADPSVEICFHLVHHRGASDPPQPRSTNPFVRKLMADYEATALQNMFTNRWFASIIIDPSYSAKKHIKDFLPFFRKGEQIGMSAEHGQVRHLEEIMHTITATLSDHKPQRLSTQDIPCADMEGETLPFTEIGTALRMIRTGRNVPVPHTWGSLGAAVYDEQVDVHPLMFDIGEGNDRYGAILAFLNYPAKPRVGMLNALMAAPYPFVISHSFKFQSLGALAAAYTIIVRQLKNSGSFASKLITGAENAIGEIEAMETAPGRHYFQLAVYAPSPVDLERYVADAKTKLSQSGGAVAKRERNVWFDGALETQYYAQLPGSTMLKPAPADISALDIASMVSLDDYPAGEKRGYWGASPIRLRTRAGTAWDLSTHDDDVGHFLGIGPNGTGKTVWGGVYMSAMEPVMGPHGIRLVIDKDDSNRLWIQASGGYHQRIRRNEPSGLAPLKAFKNTPATQAMLHGLYNFLIERDGRGPITNDEDTRLMRGISLQLQMPVDKRSMWGVRELLGYADRVNGAGARFERWCRGRSMGWLLDNEEQTINIGPGLHGVDFGDLLPKEGQIDDGTAEIAASVIAYNLKQFVDGRKIFCLFDECRFYIRVLGKLIEDFTLTGRKKELICGLLFQQPEHATESDIGSSLIAQMRRKYIFPSSGYVPANLAKLGLTKPAIRQVMGDMTIGNARRFLVWDEAPVIVDFDLTGMEQLDILSSRPQNVILFDRLVSDMPDEDRTAVIEEFHRGISAMKELAA